jgi:hypothetical protein
MRLLTDILYGVLVALLMGTAIVGTRMALEALL